MPSTLKIKVVGPHGVGDESVWSEDLVGSSLTDWVERYGITLADVWTLRHKEGGDLRPFRSFADQGVTTGSTIQIEAAGHSQRKSVNGQVDESVKGLLSRTCGMLPERLSGARRVAKVVAAPFARSARGNDAEDLAPQIILNSRKKGRLKRAIESSDYQATLSREIGHGRGRRCGVVAVVSAEGGAKGSAVANLIATTLMTYRREPVLLLDGVINGGAVRKIVGPTAFSVDEAASSFEELDHIDRKTAHGFLSRIPNGLNVLPAARDQEPAGISRKYKTVIRHLREHLAFIVIDCGTGLYNATTVEALSACDQIVVVTGMDPISNNTTGQAVKDLESLGRPITVVVNQFPTSGTLIELGRVVGLAAMNNKTTLGVIPESEDGEALVARGSFSWERGPTEWLDLVKELVVVLVGYWASNEVGVVRDR